MFGPKERDVLTKCDRRYGRWRCFSSTSPGTIWLRDDADDLMRPGDQTFEGRHGQLGCAEENETKRRGHGRT
jgi:hypothetical protein